MPEQENASRRSDNRIDALLRDALAPDHGTVDRLVANALARPDQRAAGSRWRLVSARRWQLAMAAAVVLAIMALPILKPWPPTAPPSGTPRDTPAVPVDTSDPRALRISNEDGPVTVTSPAGSKMVFLPPVVYP